MEKEKGYIKTIILEEKIRTYGSDLNVLHMLKSKKDKSEKNRKESVEFLTNCVILGLSRETKTVRGNIVRDTICR